MSIRARPATSRPDAPHGRFGSRMSALARWIGPVVVAAAGTAMVCWSWRMWPAVLIDFGRELYVPWQLTEGKVLYADIAYFNGPLSPYLNSLWFRAFGVSLLTLAAANIAILAALVWLLYRLLTNISDRTAAIVACLVFVTVFACRQLDVTGNYNFICPYSHEATHGVTLAFAGVFCLSLYLRRRSVLPIAGAGLALGLAFLTKVEVFVAAGVALVAGLGLTLWAQRPAVRRAIVLLAAFVACAVVPPAAAFGLLSLAMPAEEALRGVAGSWVPLFGADVTSLTFYRHGIGLDQPVSNLKAMLAWVGWYAAVFGPAAGLGLLLRRPGRHRIAIAVALFLAAAGLLRWWAVSVGWRNIARPLPLFMLVAAGLLFAVFLRNRRDLQITDQVIRRLTLVILAGILLGKVLLNTHLFHYGFVLAMPASLLLVVTLVTWLPQAITRLKGYGGVFRATALGVLLVTTWMYLRVTGWNFDQRTLLVGSGADAFWAKPSNATAVRLMLDQIGQNVGPGQTLAVLPEGVMLNYLARRTNPTPYINLVPPELLMFGEDRILDTFRTHPPDYIVLTHRDTSEYGLRFFGRDYGQRILAWIREAYRPVKLFGHMPLQGDQGGIILLRRAASP